MLINGAGGAVGGYAIQLAKQARATVTATASAGSAGRVRSYGADRIIDYTATPLLQAVTGQQFDVVLNLVRTSPEETAQLADLAADGGAFVITTGPAPDPERGVRAVQMSARSDAAQLGKLVARVDAGELTIDVAQRRPLADLAAVHDQAAAGELPGKAILIPLNPRRMRHEQAAARRQPGTTLTELFSGVAGAVPPLARASRPRRFSLPSSASRLG